MAESRPLLGSESLRTGHKRDNHGSLYPVMKDDICQEGPSQSLNQPGGPSRYQQGGCQPHQPVGWIHGQTSSSLLTIQPQSSPCHQTAWNSQPTGLRNESPPQSLHEDRAREALLRYISSTCCWSSGTAQDMIIKDIVPSSVFDYKLETFTESRTIRTVSEPYDVHPVPLVANRTSPNPWEIRVGATPLFQNSEQEVEIPNTISIKICHGCHGKGFLKCDRCNGKGGDKCHMCNRGNNNRSTHHVGNVNDRDCSFCDGHGQKPCSGCKGNGSRACSSCKGKSQLRTCLKLTVTRNNKTDNVVGKGTGIPDKLISKAQGRVTFREELPRVNPITHFQDESINNASRQLIQKHKCSQNEKIIKQRQRVKLVPTNRIHCVHKGHHFHYFVFGFDNKVYAPDYPDQCCCTIL